VKADRNFKRMPGRIGISNACPARGAVVFGGWGVVVEVGPRGAGGARQVGLESDSVREA
jgi:hypothetical protein